MFLTGCKRKNGLAPTERNTTMNNNLKLLAAFAAVALAGGGYAPLRLCVKNNLVAE